MDELPKKALKQAPHMLHALYLPQDTTGKVPGVLCAHAAHLATTSLMHASQLLVLNSVTRRGLSHVIICMAVGSEILFHPKIAFSIPGKDNGTSMLKFDHRLQGHRGCGSF